MQEKKWKETDIFKVIKEGKATLLLINLAISSFQKRIAEQFGIEAGAGDDPGHSLSRRDRGAAGPC